MSVRWHEPSHMSQQRRVNIQVAEFTWDAIDKKAVDTARVLAADSVEAAATVTPAPR